MAPATTSRGPLTHERYLMSLDLKVILIVAVFSTVTGFVTYWLGVAATERRHKARERKLLDDLDFTTALLTAEPQTPILRLVGGEA